MPWKGLRVSLVLGSGYTSLVVTSVSVQQSMQNHLLPLSLSWLSWRPRGCYRVGWSPGSAFAWPFYLPPGIVWGFVNGTVVGLKAPRLGSYAGWEMYDHNLHHAVRRYLIRQDYVLTWMAWRGLGRSWEMLSKMGSIRGKVDHDSYSSLAGSNRSKTQNLCRLMGSLLWLSRWTTKAYWLDKERTECMERRQAVWEEKQLWTWVNHLYLNQTTELS